MTTPREWDIDAAKYIAEAYATEIREGPFKTFLDRARRLLSKDGE